MTRLLLLTFVFIFSTLAIATPHNTLLKVKSVSTEKRSFITRQGRFDGIAQGTTLVFKANDVSFSAKAIAVSRFYTQWQILNPHMSIPIKADDYLVAYKGEEYMWAHTDGKTVTQKHREALRPNASWLSGGFSYIRGLSNSISNVKDDIEVSRNGFGLQMDYFSEISKKLYWSAGFRFENETIDIKAGTLTTTRFEVLASIYYMSAKFSSLYGARLLTGVGIGAGTSNTTSSTTSQSGSALILPSITASFLFEIDQTWSWSAGLAAESISTKETIENQSQSTDQLNLKIMIGFHRFFNGLSQY